MYYWKVCENRLLLISVKLSKSFIGDNKLNVCKVGYDI